MQPLPQRTGAAGVIVVTMGQEQILDLFQRHAQGQNISAQFVLRFAAAGIDESGMAVVMDQLDRGIVGRGQSVASYLVDFIGYF